MQAVLDEFDEYLELQCGRSAHTRRAYLGDLRSLFDFLTARGSDLQTLSLPVLRSWLAGAAGAGAGITGAGPGPAPVVAGDGEDVYADPDELTARDPFTDAPDLGQGGDRR